MIGALHMVLVLTALGAVTEGRANVTRATVPAGETTSVKVPRFDELIVVDPSVAQVRRSASGLEIVGTRSGRTQVQLYRGPVMSLVMISVTSPVSRAADSAPVQINGLGHRGPITSLFGANSITTQIDYNSQFGTWNTDTIEASGLINEGLYHADLRATFGALGRRLLHAQAMWSSKDGQSGFTAGDMTLFVPASRLFSAMPALGLDVRFGDPSLKKNIYLGNLSTSGTTSSAQPIAGGNLDGRMSVSGSSKVSFSHAASLFGFSDAPTALTPGRTGAFVGERLRLDHSGGYALEARAGAMLSSQKDGRLSNELGGEAGVALYHQNTNRRSASLTYDMNVGSMYNPLLHFVTPVQHRAALGYGERFGKSVYASTSLGYTATVLGANVTHAYSAGAFAQATFSARTVGYLQATQQGSHVAGPGPADPRTRRNIGLEARHTFDEATSGRVALQYQDTYSVTGSRNAVVASVQGTHRSAKNWFVDANGSVLVEKNTVALAVDQPPLAVQTTVGANGGWVTTSFGAVAGLSVQKIFSASPVLASPVGVSFNAGIQYSPTLAHRIGATFAMTQYVGTPRNVVSASLAYTFQFGDSIHAPSLIQVFSGAELDGVVCVDSDANGACEQGEEPVADVEVKLSTGQRVLTDAHGRYHFGGLRAGSYSVEVDEVKLASLGRLTSPRMRPVEIRDQYRFTESFGVQRGCEIRGRVTHDLDVSGGYSDADTSVEAAVVRASGPNGIEEATTDSYGEFRINVPECGAYSVEVLAERLPASTRVVTDAIEVEVSLKSNPKPLAFSISALRSMTGVVFLDANGNGQQDTGERVLSNVRVSWFRNGALGATTQTNARGEMLFRRLPAGRITLSIEAADSAKGEFEPGTLELVMPNGPDMQQGVALPVVPRNKF